MRRRPKCSPSPPSPATTGPRCGRPTRWNGSTKRSNAAPAWSASFPTSPPSSASSAPSWPTCTTNGRSATAATYPKAPWPNSKRPAIMRQSPQSQPATRHRGSLESPPRHGAQSDRALNQGRSEQGKLYRALEVAAAGTPGALYFGHLLTPTKPPYPTQIEIAVCYPVKRCASSSLTTVSAHSQQARRFEAVFRYFCGAEPQVTLLDYDCLAASRLARYSRSPSSSGWSASYLDSASEMSFDLGFANLAVTFTAPLATK